ncbi:hypothetical protein V8B97DRAFT_2026940 [Scleroderma yunnanense]
MYFKTTKASVQTPWWHHHNRVVVIWTPTKKAAIKEKAKEHKAAYADALAHAQDIFSLHTIKYYFKAIFQSSHLSKKKGPNQWNTCLQQEVRKYNEEPEMCQSDPAQNTITFTWNSITQAEKEAATKGTMEDLREHCENKAIIIHNVPISSFHDAHATLDSITHEVCVFYISNLSAHTGQKITLISIWGDIEHLQCPFVWLVSNYKESFLTLKKETAALILLKLAAQTPMLKMFYANFDDQITVKHGIVVINWPLKNFQSPSNVGSMTKLKVLYNAWKTGMATFCKLTCLEWEEWDNACFKACIAESQSANGEIGPELHAGGLPAMLMSTIATYVVHNWQPQ